MQEQRIKDASMRTPETPCEAEIIPKKKQETRQTGASPQEKMEEGKTSEETQQNKDPQRESDNPAAPDKLLRHMQERGPAPATMEWIPRAARPRVTTILTGLISENEHASEVAERSEWDTMRWRTSMLLHVAPSVSHSKPKKQKQNEGGSKESNHMKMMKETRRRLQLSEKDEWNRLLSSHTGGPPAQRQEGEKRRGHRRGIAASTRAQQGNISGACQALVGRSLTANSQDTDEKVKSMVAMDVTSDEHKELESARKEANKMRSKVPEMTTGAVKRRVRVLKAGAALGHSGLRNNHIRAIAVAPGGLRATAAWIAAWAKGKQGHQEMKAWNAALIVPLDRGRTRVRSIALTEALVKLAQGILMERIHRKLRKNAEPSRTKSEGKAQHIGHFSVITPMGAEVLAIIVGHLTWTNTLRRAHELLRSTLRDTTEALVGTALSEEEHNIVSAPGPFGGCSLRVPSNTIADAAFLSSWLCTREAVQQHADDGKTVAARTRPRRSTKSKRQFATNRRGR